MCQTRFKFSSASKGHVESRVSLATSSATNCIEITNKNILEISSNLD